jgi:hypothetical protein
MSINTRLASQLISILARNGFDVTLQQKSDQPAGDYDASTVTWSDVATVKACWDTPRIGRKGINDGAPQSEFQRQMTIAYRAGFKDTVSAVGARVVVDGVNYNILSAGVIGEQVGLRLYLDAGA